MGRKMGRKRVVVEVHGVEGEGEEVFNEVFNYE